ncbi:MAG: M20/M25/M40 family metallo-hydrolase, partial [Acidobacteria bacterium]|nr:M20/M25/M40 family metallo-hydrolase [Acidobacteriota bacterium]
MKRIGLILITGLLAPAAAAGQNTTIEALVKQLADEIIGYRHQIHENPELGNREFETAALVASHLESLGIEIQTGVAHTGVVGILRGGRPGPVIAVRADMDALPVTEDTPFPFKSLVRTEYLGQDVGVMHACGHDIHTSVQMGVASILAAMRDEIPGTIKFIFQPAEEGPPPGEEYTSQPGDNLYDIGLVFGVGYLELQRYNRLSEFEASNLQVGSTIIIPPPPGPAPGPGSPWALGVVSPKVRSGPITVRRPLPRSTSRVESPGHGNTPSGCLSS